MLYFILMFYLLPALLTILVASFICRIVTKCWLNSNEFKQITGLALVPGFSLLLILLMGIIIPLGLIVYAVDSFIRWYRSYFFGIEKY